MQRKPGLPSASCGIKMPNTMSPDPLAIEEEMDHAERRQQLINFGHMQWGFNNWNWSVIKQDLDFVDFSNGKYCAGVAAFVSVTVKSLDIHRENIGYATTVALNKGLAIHKSRRCAVTDALRETLLSFGGTVATELTDVLEPHKAEVACPCPGPGPLPPVNLSAPLSAAPPNLAPTPIAPEPQTENNNIPNKNLPPNKNMSAIRSPHPAVKSAAGTGPQPQGPPVARAHPMPVSPPSRAPPAPAPRPPPPPPPPLRPDPNVSFVLQPVMGAPLVPPMYAPPRLAAPQLPPPLYSNYYEYSAGPWHFTYESYNRHHGNVNLNFNLPPKNLVVNSRSGSVECKNACSVRQGPSAEGDPIQYQGPNNQSCWIKPTIFYDGFWTEQKVKKWVAEQVEKQFPEDSSLKSSSPSTNTGPSDTAPAPPPPPPPTTKS